jgi:hypothetical protein
MEIRRRIMNKRIAVIVIILIVFIGVSINRYNININPEESFNTIVLDSDRDSVATTPEELIENSDLIIVGKIEKDKENVLFYDSLDKNVISGHTLTNIKVKKVLKGDYIKKNVLIVEGYYKVESTIFAYDNYVPLVKSNYYLLFLNKAKDSYFNGKYYLGEYDYSKYKINMNDMTKLEKKEFQELLKVDQLYSKWYEIIENYYRHKSVD